MNQFCGSVGSSQPSRRRGITSGKPAWPSSKLEGTVIFAGVSSFSPLLLLVILSPIDIIGAGCGSYSAPSFT